MANNQFGWDLAIGDVRGTRAWRLAGDKLLAVNYDQVWVRGENRAECRRQRQAMQYTTGYGAPIMSGFVAAPCRGMEVYCQCGFYAYLQGINDYMTEYGNAGAYGFLIGGTIRGWGKTVVGTRGFRTERAEILALYIPPMSLQIIDHEVLYGMSSAGYQTTRAVREMRPIPLADVAKLQGRLGDAYHVPVFTDWKELLQEFPPTDPEVKKED